MRVTMKDVAQRSGFSIKTVSRVVNGEGEISEETVRRVKAVIDELGYRPNQMARGLVSQRTHSIGLVVPEINNPFYPEVAQAVISTARENHHHMLLCSHENSYQEQEAILESLVYQGVDGIILFPARNSMDQLLRFADSYGPIVSVNHNIAHPRIGIAQADIVKGASLAVDYLVGKGHTHIGMINAKRSPVNRRWREQGFKQAMIAHQLAFTDDLLIAGDELPNDIEGGYHAARTVLSERPQITALFCYNDMMALGAINACQDLGVRVPDAFAIVGFDDISIASIVRPALTTVRIDKYKLGAEATHMLLTMLENANSKIDNVTLDVDLVIRQSA